VSASQSGGGAASLGAGPGELLVAADVREHAALVSELMARAIWTAVEQRGVARVAISGGSSPSDAHRHLASLELPWPSVEWFWVDERAVPPEHARSNYGSARRDLGLDRMPPERVHRMEAEAADREAAAVSYERLLRRTFGVAAAVAFDVMTLGVGDDGHTASLFPGLGLTWVDDRLVLAVPEQHSKGLEPRLTLSAPVIHEARLVLVIARGAGKRAMIEAARGPGDVEAIPSRTIQRSKGRVVWVVDREAAGTAG
jgi:6-phosphogluconolactonase